MQEVDKTIPSQTVSTDATRVRVGMGFTRNMGNFESMRIDVAVEDSARNGEKGNDLFDRVYAITERKLLEKFAATEEELRNAGN